MMRMLLVLTLAVLAPISVFAADNGGFGESFRNKPPSALAETPNSEVAQSVQTPSAEDLQNIMPAAGDETGADQKMPVTPDSLKAPVSDQLKMDGSPSSVKQ